MIRHKPKLPKIVYLQWDSVRPVFCTKRKYIAVQVPIHFQRDMHEIEQQL